MADYSFVTRWRFRAPLAPVWELVYNSDQWPEWWRGVERVEKIEPGDAEGIGSIRRYTWKSKTSPPQAAGHSRGLLEQV